MKAEMGADGTAATAHDPVATVAAWRTRGAAAFDPVRFGVIEALARRAAAQQGEARRLLTQRVEHMLAEHAAQPTASEAATVPDAACRGALAELSGLVDRLGRTPTAPSPGLNTLPRSAPPAPLKAVAAFKRTWSRLRAEQRLRQTLAQVPARAGPLNASHVVHGALQAMHQLSPAYLDAFMSHIDTLLWLEQASGGDIRPVAARAAPKGATKPARPGYVPQNVR